MSKKEKQITIGFFYYNFYPIKGGASVHGFNLAKELSEKGYRLLKVNGESDPYTEKRKGLIGLIYALMNSDVAFVRLDFFLKPRNIVPLIAKMLGKPVIAELNCPSDELILLGHGKSYKRIREKWIRFVVRFVDKMIAVSQPVKDFCTIILKHDNVEVIENGGEAFNKEGLSISGPFLSKVEKIRNEFSKLIIWTGSTNKLQEMDFLKAIAKSLSSKYALIIITNEFLPLEKTLKDKENVFQFSSLKRDELGLAIHHADIGLALFTDYSWCRWGYYNSSLKVYEYLSNNVFVLTNKKEVVKKHEPVKLIEEPSFINDYCEKIDCSLFDLYNPRTWKDVANDLEDSIKEVLKSYD